jgi:TrmH family RNA methyltransferase
MDAVIVCGASVDVYNPNVVRASVGALFTVPVVEADAAAVRVWLREHGFMTIMTSPTAAKPYHEVAYQGRVALVLGSEADGLGADWLHSSGIVVRIPMRGKMDSLNLSCSGAILMYAIKTASTS